MDLTEKSQMDVDGGVTGVAGLIEFEDAVHYIEFKLLENIIF
jgi:hypothetical protein